MWQLPCEHSWRPGWKSSKAHEAGSCTHEVNCACLSLYDYGHKTAWNKNMYSLQTASYTKKQCFSTKWLMPSLHQAVCAENLFYIILEELPFPLGPVWLCSKWWRSLAFIGRDQQEKPAFLPGKKDKIPASLKCPGDVVQQKHCNSICGNNRQESFVHLLWIHSQNSSIRALHPAPMEYNHQRDFPAAHAPRTPGCDRHN